MKKLVLALCCALAFVAGCSKEGSKVAIPVKPVETYQAPPINVTSLDGTPLSLTALKGKVVLLNFWATWCPPCREEIPSLMKLNKAMEGKPFQMVCVSVDEGGQKAVTEFFKNTGFLLPAYPDPTGQAANIYGITGVPETFVIDKTGIIVKKVVGGMDWNSAEVTTFLENLMK